MTTIKEVFLALLLAFCASANALPGQVFYHHTDELGSPVVTTNEQAVVVADARYSLFGERRMWLAPELLQTTAGRGRAKIHLFSSLGWQGFCSRRGWHIHWSILCLPGRWSLYTLGFLLTLAQPLPALASGWMLLGWRGTG